MDNRDEMTRARIQELNDRLRQTGTGGRVMLTRAIAALPHDLVSKILATVRAFDAFNGANDPWSEHDFGQVEVEDAAYFWKIDTYDLNLEYGSPDPSDENVTRRILTVMTARDV